jgi:hypothetical protein
MREDGRSMALPRRLTPSDHNERASGWSPGSDAVLFTSDERGTLGAFVQPLDGDAPRPLGVGVEHKTWPAFSGDGASLLYWQLARGPEGASGTPRLMRTRPDGSEPEALFTMNYAALVSAIGSPPPQIQRFRCARRGPRCVVSEDVGRRVIFSTFEPAIGAPLRPFLDVDAAKDRGHYGWSLSPDGARLALPLRTGLHTYPVEGGPPETYPLRDDCGLRHVDWNARGDGFFVTAICRGDDEMYQLWAVFADGAPHVLWKSSNSFVSDVTASPDGRHVAFSVKPYDNDVWLLETPSGE